MASRFGHVLKQTIGYVRTNEMAAISARMRHEFLARTRIYGLRLRPSSWNDLLTDSVESDVSRIRAEGCSLLPAVQWDAELFESSFGADAVEISIGAADRVVAGELPYFGAEWRPFSGGAAWWTNPRTGATVSRELPWHQASFYSPKYGDLKLVLEPSRWAAAYVLGKAYILTTDEKYAEWFWQLFEDWCRWVAPFEGPLWLCGQEAALRIAAWAFAIQALERSPSSTFERQRLLFAAVWAHAQRIQVSLPYAISQRNNHAVIEPVGLLTAALILPHTLDQRGLIRYSLTAITRECDRQFYEDGSYIQHSLNYERFALQGLLWAVALVRSSGLRNVVTEPWIEAMRRAADFLGALADEDTGRVPNLGSNDGAEFLRLDSSPFWDYRPIVDACRYIESPSTSRAAESAFWLFGAVPQDESVTVSYRSSPTTAEVFGPGGVVILRGRSGRAILRASSYEHRPHQADQLHADVWWGSENVAVDAGTYLYNGEPPWDNGLARTAAHNTVTVDQRDQMERLGRFLWARWSRATVAVRPRTTGTPLVVDLEHDGYRRVGVTHRRTVAMLDDSGTGFVVIDRLRAIDDSSHAYCLRWLLGAEDAWETDGGVVELATLNGVYRIYAIEHLSAIPGKLSWPREDEVPGWFSPTYSVREPRPRIECWAEGTDAIFVSVLSPEEPALASSQSGKELILALGGRAYSIAPVQFTDLSEGSRGWEPPYGSNHVEVRLL